MSGIGLVLTRNDPYVSVDIDNCIHGEEIEDRVVQIPKELKSYTKIATCGYGVPILLESAGFYENASTAALEVYSQSHYVTVTKHHVSGTLPEVSIISGDVVASLLPPSTQVDKPLAHPSRAERSALGDVEL